MADKVDWEGIVRTYKVWVGMIRRCRDHENYAGRGISVCERWQTDFGNFLDDVGIRPSQRYSIEREDVDGNYEPGNCHWADPREQVRNRRNTIKVEYNGEIRVLAEVCEERGVSLRMVYGRITKMKWPLEKAIITKPGSLPKYQPSYTRRPDPRTHIHNGHRVGILTVRVRDLSKKGPARYICECDCGIKIVALYTNLKIGQPKSCGCLIYQKNKPVRYAEAAE